MGVSGSFLAYLLARRGFRVEGYDLSRRYLKPCGNAVSVKELTARVVKATESELAQAKRFSVKVEGEEIAYLDLRPSPWVMVDKGRLVGSLREMAEAEGALLRYGKHGLSSATVDARGPFAGGGGRQINAIVIMARTRWEPGEVSLDLTVSRRGTFWIFPQDEDGRVVNVGVGFDRYVEPRVLRQVALRYFKRMLGRFEELRVGVAPILIWSPLRLSNGPFLVGEAAGFVGRLNGEGNRMALYSAAALAEALASGYPNQEKVLKAYRERTARLANEVRTSMLLLELVGRLSTPVAREVLRGAPKELWESWFRTELTLGRLLSLLPTALSASGRGRGLSRALRSSPSCTSCS